MGERLGDGELMDTEISKFGPERFSSRELSRLEFGARLLDLAEDQTVPLLDRCKFIAIFADMVDEFFQVRVVSLEDKVAAGVQTPGIDGVRPRQQLALIRERVIDLVERQDRLVLDVLIPELNNLEIQVVKHSELDEDSRANMARYFDDNIFPVLTPLSVDPGHPFPMISNLSLNIGVLVKDEANGDERRARIKVPSSLPRFLPAGGGRYVLIESVIMAHIDRLFPGMTISQADLFRVTRNADLSLDEDEADDLLVAVEIELRRRRFGDALRIEIQKGFSEDFLDLLMSELNLDRDHVYVSEAPLSLHDFWSLYAIDRPELKSETWSPVTPKKLLDGDHVGNVFQAIQQGDILLHHPYDSFTDSVEQFISQAAEDPKVLGIKITLYRTSGDSPIVASLIRAAGSGKQVVALVELKARFDEEANIEWARALEDAGVHVVYGIVGLKTHSKIAMVLRSEDQKTNCYVHIATGNYNGKTARVYEDFGLLTCNQEIARDAVQLFNYLTGFAKSVKFEKLITSPHNTRDQILECIITEAAKGEKGKIDIKVNGLTDPSIIDALYQASEMKCEIRLIVRTLCCLRPGVPGFSSNITVHSLVGQFLEHSRIFQFGRRGEEDYRLIIGSADLMERNLDRRVEVLVPITDVSVQREISDAFEITWSDDEFTWILGTDRRWRRIQTVNHTSAQESFKKLALQRNHPVD